MTRLALVMGANGGIGSAICERLRADGVHVRTMDAVGRADVVADLSADAIPPWALADADICVSVAGVVNTFAPALDVGREVFARHRRQPHWSLPGHSGLPSWNAASPVRPGSGDLEHGGLARSGGKGRLRCLQGRPARQVRTIAIENVATASRRTACCRGMIATPKLLMMPQADQDRIRAALPSQRFGRPPRLPTSSRFSRGTSGATSPLRGSALTAVWD
jgi:hypothetical protein